MRFLMFALAAVLACVLASAGSTAAVAAGITDAAGNWNEPDSGAILAFYECDGDLCGKIAKPSDPAKTDSLNPDAAKRATPLTGLVILDHAKKSDDGGWKGNLYNTRDGKTYAGYVTVTAPGTLQLKGCTALVFCKTLLLTKAAP